MKKSLIITSAVAGFLAALTLLTSCSPKNNILTISTTGAASQSTGGSVYHNPNAGMTPDKTLASKPVGMVLKASAFQMSGDYADKVAVTLDSKGNLIYYPAPTDLTAASAPVSIGDGWWLNRQGLGPNSVFTSYTFDQYRALKKAPSVEEIKKAIIPGACVTDFRTLPVTASKAAGMTPSELLKLIVR